MKNTTKKFKLGPLQQKWLDALKSGEYKKGKGKLRTLDDEYCCLGVGCETLGIKPIEDKNCFDYKYNYRSCIAPKEMVEKLKLKNGYGNFLPTNNNSSLVEINDEKSPSGTFKEVIAVFKETPELIFTESA